MSDPATNMTDEWIKAALAKNPCVKLENGNIRTCPVRLSFVHVFKPGKAIEEGKEPKYGVSVLFPVGADISVLQAEARAVAQGKWPKAGTPEGPKLKGPFLKQDDDAERYIGYRPGGVLIRALSNQRIAVVDQNLAPIVDEARVYPGVWAIVTLRAFAYDMGVNKGVSFGLQSVMIIADDQNIGGTGQDNPSTDFASVQVDANLNPSALFGAEGGTAGGQDSGAASSLFE